MKKIFSCLSFLLLQQIAFSQTNPAITSWLINNTTFGSYYTVGNSTATSNGILANVQKVQYNTTDVYVTTTGVPSYPTGPFQDGNPSQASNQNAIFKIPLNPTYPYNGTKSATTGGNIGIFINGVALFDYRDGVSWNNNTNSLCGGPGNPPCPGGTQAWNRDAVLAERSGFDCAKGHPAMGNYHHHQNPTAFNLDLVVLSTVCNMYASNGLYVINPSIHSPLLGYAYDGFPIYGAYAYKNTDGTGGITRMKSSYSLKNITTRTNGPAVSTTYPLGYFREDYEYISNSNPDYLDASNGRFCKTPEYPNGTYAYFCTVDANHNSAYPYAVGPNFYGPIVVSKVTTVPAGTTTLATNEVINYQNENFKSYYNRNMDMIFLQSQSVLKENLKVGLYSAQGLFLSDALFKQGSSILNIDASKLNAGVYFLKLKGETNKNTIKILINK